MIKLFENIDLLSRHIVSYVLTVKYLDCSGLPTLYMITVAYFTMVTTSDKTLDKVFTSYIMCFNCGLTDKVIDHVLLIENWLSIHNIVFIDIFVYLRQHITFCIIFLLSDDHTFGTKRWLSFN